MENSLDKKYITILILKFFKPSTCDWLLSLQTDPLLYRIDLNRNLIFLELVEFCHMKAIKKQDLIFFGNSNYCQIKYITPIWLGLPLKMI
jgi:hypothetical protein